MVLGRFQTYDSVMLVLNDLSFDSRVRNEAAALAAGGWRVLVIGTQRADGSLPDREQMRGFDVLRVRYGRWGAAKWWPWRWLRHAIQAARVINTVRQVPARVLHAHDLPALLLITVAQRLRTTRAQVIYDAHELYLFQSPPESRLARLWHNVTRPVFMAVERRLMRRAAAVITLSEIMARVFTRWYGIAPPTVIVNALDPVPAEAHAPVDLRAVVGPNRRIVVHTGFVDVRRRAVLELIEALALIPEDVVLVLLGPGEGAHTALHHARAHGVADRMVVVDAVPPEQVAVTLRAADVAAVLLRTESWNTRAGTPNKLYEALAAGVSVIASNLPVLWPFVRQYRVGVLCDQDDPASIAAALREALDPARQVELRKAVRMAQAAFSEAGEGEKLRAVYREVLGD